MAVASRSSRMANGMWLTAVCYKRILDSHRIGFAHASSQKPTPHRLAFDYIVFSYLFADFCAVFNAVLNRAVDQTFIGSCAGLEALFFRTSCRISIFYPHI